MGALRISALVAVVLGVLQLVGAGKVGCVYDETVCSGAESCVDDSLFGVCIVRELADDAEVAEINHRILERLTDDEERSRELRLLLTYLGRSGFSWQSPFTQCVIDAFRVSLITQAETAEYGRCVGVHESADGQLTSSFSLADLERETAADSGPDSADADADAEDESSEEDVEEAAAKRDEQISIHKYFKKLDSNSGARGNDVERRVDDVLSMSNDELRRRIAELRVQVATALYQDRLNGQSNPDKRAGAAESESESQDSDADRELTKAMLGSLVNKMKQRVLQRIEELDARRGQDEDSVERFAIDEDGSSSEEQLSPNVAGESAMRAASAADIEVDKKSPNAPTELSYVMASPSQQPSQYELDRDIDDRFGIIELSGSVSPLVGAEAVFNEIVEVVKWPGSVCLKFDGVTGKTSNILRFYVPRDRLCQGVRAAEFLDAVWDKRELVKQAIRHDVVIVAVGRDKTRMTNAAQQVSETEPNGELLVTVIVCAVVLCIVLLAVIVFIVCTMVRRRRNRSDFDKSLLLGNDAPETYGELCRQRMTATVNEKLEAIPVPVRSLFGRSKVFTARSSPPASKSSPDRSQLTSTSSTSAWVDEPPQTNMDITTGHAILSYMEAFLRNPEKLELEWQGLSEYEADRKAANVGQREENRIKNRYPSLLPYDHNRVVLTNYIGGDYVNASFIADHDPRSPAYVATQCPLQETANDFWHMVWEHGGNIIVNLTSCSTRGSDGNNNAGNDTDYHYWPSEGMETFGSLELHLVSEHLVCEDYVVRNFYLKNAVTNETRTITQFHFVSWTDSSVPSIRSLLEFRRKVIKSHHHGKSKPIVVHCSDGCGRTGTYCLVDLVLNRIAKGTVKEVDVGATIEHLRDQRTSMVATKKQFEFALMTIADEVNAVLKALAAQQNKQ